MAWTVETLNGVVDAELEALPPPETCHVTCALDFITSRSWLKTSASIEFASHTSSTCTARFGRCVLERARRYLASHLCHRHPPARGRGEGVR